MKDGSDEGFAEKTELKRITAMQERKPPAWLFLYIRTADRKGAESACCFPRGLKPSGAIAVLPGRKKRNKIRKTGGCSPGFP